MEELLSDDNMLIFSMVCTTMCMMLVLLILTIGKGNE